MKLGTNDIGSVYLGTNSVQKVYLGTNEVWSAVDPDAQAFFDRVTTAGGTLSTTEQNAVNTLVVQMKADGIWTKMKAIYPMVGASAAACAQNLKSSSFTGTFFGGVTFASTGIKGNGTNGYMDTFLSPITQLQQNNTHISLYISDNVATQNSPLGVTNSATAINELGFYPRTTSDTVLLRINASAGSITTSTDSRAFHIGSRVISSQIKYYKNNSIFSFSNNVNSLSGNTIPVMAFRYLSSVVGFYTGEISFVSIGDGINDTEASDFYTAVQAFQTTLARQV